MEGGDSEAMSLPLVPSEFERALEMTAIIFPRVPSENTVGTAVCLSSSRRRLPLTEVGAAGAAACCGRLAADEDPSVGNRPPVLSGARK